VATLAQAAPRAGTARRAVRSAGRWLSASAVVLGPLAVSVLVIGLWQAGAWNDLFGLGRFILPRPSEILHAFGGSSTVLLNDLGSSSKPAILGYAIGNGAGFLAAIAIVLLPAPARRRTSAFFTGVQALPIIALAPLIELWVGAGLMYKACVVAVLSFPSMMVFASRGMTHLPDDVHLLMASYDATPLQVFVKVRIPSALPFAFTALKYTTVLALVGVTISELLASRSGLGYEISNSLQAFETPTAWAAVAILGGLGISWYTLLGAVERIAVPWGAAQRNR
jgi:NitT/TauT family transport system permease protein